PKGYRMVEFKFYNELNAVLAINFKSISLEVWARLITISTALITSFFLYLIGKRLLGKWEGILSAFFYLFIPFNIYFTRVILPDPMGVMFGVISLWAFLKFTDNDKKLFLITSGIFFGLAMLIKPYLGFYIFPIIYLALKKYGIKKFLTDKKIIINTLIYFILAFVPFILWRVWEGQFPEGIPFYEWAFNGNLIRFKPSFWYWIFGERLGHLILGSLGLIPFIFGVVNTKVKNLFIHAFLAGALFYVVAVAAANVMHDYYQILTIPVISLTLAAGTIYLWTTQIYNKILTRIIVLISIGVMLITGWNQIVGNYNINHPEIIEAGKVVDKITPKDAIVIAPYNGDTAFLYQTKRFGWPVIDSSIDRMISQGADYYVSVDLGSADTKMIQERFKTVEKTDKYIIIDLHEPLIIK
ncbi:MAG: glycosyltransferase family 39 protein, partial [Candidatus Woesebacteria bacterium]|nr:glycosyltransferase family 39 protein [Candidatus Woesebacteria bacterium]